jgi:hypothetical protein
MSLTFDDSHCSRHCENAMNSNRKYNIPKKNIQTKGTSKSKGVSVTSFHEVA